MWPECHPAPGLAGGVALAAGALLLTAGAWHGKRLPLRPPGWGASCWSSDNFRITGGIAAIFS